MKKFLIGLLVLVLVAMLGTLGYLIVDSAIRPELPKDTDAVAVNASAPPEASEAAAGGGASFGFSASGSGGSSRTKELKTDADILTSIDGEYEKNKDTIGWLSVPGTNINASVVQSFNNIYYLRRDERKKDNLYGCYFADFECSFGGRGELSENSVIYGHSDLKDSKDGPKFSELFRLTDEAFARSHPILHFSTKEAPMVWQILAVSYTDLSLPFARAELNDTELLALVEGGRERSIYDYDVSFEPGDKLLTLVTCTVKYGAKEKDQRLIVMAKLLPEGAQIPGEAALSPNPDPVQPKFD